MIIKSTELYTAKVEVEGCERKRHAVYRYILLENEKTIEYVDRKIKLPCFGIEIIREDINDEDRVYYVERDRIEYMTTYRYKVVQLLKKLYDNCVSPVHLIDIAGSEADDWASDFDDQLGSIAVQ